MATEKSVHPPSQIQPYSPSVYNTVNHSLHRATQKFSTRNAQPIVNTLIRDCFLKHHVEEVFSACLIHRHYELAANERNVEADGKAIASSDLVGLYPSSWMFFDGKCYPYEFKRYAVPQPPEEFVQEFGKVLQETGFCDLIGLQTYTNGVVGIEGTVDKVSTTVEQDENLPIPEGMASASWAFFRI